MSPRPGGEAAKFGNRYEGAWTVRHVLYILAGRGESITVEDHGELGQGVEFTYRRSDGVEVHQLKRQHGTVNSWSVASLQRLGIWENARHHVAAGREFHFVSVIPGQVLRELCDFARRSASLEDFIAHWLPNKRVRAAFDELTAPQLLGSAQTAWQVLGGTWIEWPDERDVAQVNAALAGLLLEGAPGGVAAVALGDLVLNNLGVKLTEAVISEELQEYEVRRATAVRSGALIKRVGAITASWSASVDRELLQPVISRYEAADLERRRAGDDGLIFVIGAAGDGKTAVLRQAIEKAHAQGHPVLAFRLDRLPSFASTTELGRQLGLEVSPVAALATAAGEQTSLLVVDQFDAVSLASGRMPQLFDVVADLVREATAFKAMQVVLACRKFDLDNDERIRNLAARPGTHTITVGPLTDVQVDAAVGAMGLNATSLTSTQRALLRSPLHLVLLATMAQEPDALAFHTSSHLFDAYWHRKRRDVLTRRPGARFASVVSTVAQEISRRQRLSVPIAILDRDDLASDAEVLISEHVLVRDGREVAFMHETLFDYAFARQWVAQSQSLIEFLTNGEQELFRRAQVRQIMNYLRESDPDRFVDEIGRFLMSADIRFHIKAAGLAVLGGLSEPTPREADMLLEVAASRPTYEERLWSHLRTSAWFARLDADGRIADWLKGDEEQQTRALTLMSAVAPAASDRLAELLSAHREATTYPSWLRWCVRFADLERSRPLLDLFLEAIRCGHYDGYEHELWLSAHKLADEHPDWAVEVLAAFLANSLDARHFDGRGRVAALTSREFTATELVDKAATGAARQYCDSLLPHLLQVMEVSAAEHDGEGMQSDAHFSFRYPESESDNALDDVLFAGMTTAIRTLAAADPVGMRPTLERLATDPYDSAQWLLYQGLIAGAAVYADWAAELLLEGRHRLLSGYASNGVWTTRQVLQAISSHISDQHHRRLEEAVRDLRFPWEKRQAGWYAFNLLSALDENRLTAKGRRRLGELRRAFSREEPPEPEGVIGGWIGPPIPNTAASHMNDANWLQAMTKHAGDREDFHTLKGGARELAPVLREQVTQDPCRFARLARQLTSDMNPAYGDAILMGLGDADPVDEDTLIYEAVRHIASWGHADNDRWLGWALRPYVKVAPLEMVELIRDRLVATSDPSDDGVRLWSQDESGRQVPDIRGSGINTARGSLAEALADFLVYDADGTRTAVATPILDQLAADPALPVRTCVARLIGASMRHARPSATEAFWRLIDTDDALLATEPVIRVLIFLGNEEPAAIRPVLQRMLTSRNTSVRKAGGQMAAFAALEWGAGESLETVLSGSDSFQRTGAAEMTANRLPRTASPDVAATALTTLMNDPHHEVRKAAAKVAGALRGQALRPFHGVLKELLTSTAFTESLPQLLITLERAPDRVDDLALLCAQRFVDVHGDEAADIQTSAAGDARQVGQLIIRGLAQARTPAERGTFLDVLDRLMLTGAYGIDDVVREAERER